MKFHENCFVVRLDIACVVFFIATRPLKGRKGEREKFERRNEGIMYY